MDPRDQSGIKSKEDREVEVEKHNSRPSFFIPRLSCTSTKRLG